MRAALYRLGLLWTGFLRFWGKISNTARAASARARGPCMMRHGLLLGYYKLGFSISQMPSATIVRDHVWGILVTRRSLTRGHVVFDTSGLFRKISVRLDPPYLQQIASIRKMPKNAIACRTSIRRFKRANDQLIDQLNFIQNRIFEGKKVPGPGSVY
jgi:hypothetical protein